MKLSETTLIANQMGGMTPFDTPVDWSRHNEGVKPCFFEEREPKVEEDGKVIVDATGKPAEHVTELCRISITGDLLSESTVPVTDAIKERFAEAYRRWKAGESAADGTLLADWGEPAMTIRFVRDLSGLNIETVEDLASIADSHINKVIDGRAWRAKALAWLRMHPRATGEETEISRLRKQNEALEKRLAALEKGLARAASKVKTRAKPLAPAKVAEAMKSKRDELASEAPDVG